jgi:hypothetical protein
MEIVEVVLWLHLTERSYKRLGYARNRL